MAGETIQFTPEQQFVSAVDALRKKTREYKIPSWIENGGKYMERHVHSPFSEEMPFPDFISFNPNAYDPARPWEPKGKLWIPNNNPEKLIEDPFDLDNLRIVPKEWVDTFYYNLEELAHKVDGRGVVGLIGMGGTIAMRRTEAGSLSPQLGARDLLKLAGGGIEEDFEIVTLDFPKPIDSSQNEIDYNAELVIALSNVWNRASDMLKMFLVGVIVAHGTDTMSASSTHTAMMLGADIPFPILFVGSQKPSDARPLSDVPANILGAFRSLDVLHSAKKNVVGVYAGGTSGGVFPAVGIEKKSDSQVSAFVSPTHPLILSAENFGADGVNCDFQDGYQRQHAQMPNLSMDFKPIVLRGYTPLIEVKAQQGEDPAELYRTIVSSKSLAVHLVTFGSFTDNDKARTAVMKAASETGKLVFASNPFPEGSVEHSYETSQKLRESGAIPTRIPPTTLRAKMAIAEHLFGRDLDNVRGFIDSTNIVGELPPRSVQPIVYGIPSFFTSSIYEGKIKNPRTPNIWTTIEH